MKNITILGKGYLGKKFYQHLTDKGHKVKIYSKSELDYTNFEKLKTALSVSDAHYVINASGYTGMPNIDSAEREKEKCWKLNVEVPATIAAAVESSKRGYLIHISSGCIYNGYEKEYTEEDVPNFGIFNPESSFYSKTKHAAETIVSKFPAYSLRIRMPFDSTRSSRNYLFKLYKYDKLISMNNSLTCINDLCRFIEKLISKDPSERVPFGIYNVVNPGFMEAKEIIAMMRDFGVINYNHSFISLDKLKTLAPRSNVVLSTQKSKELGIELPNVLESMKKEMYYFYRNHYSNKSPLNY